MGGATRAGWHQTGLVLVLVFVVGILVGVALTTVRPKERSDSPTAVTIGPGGCSGVDSMATGTTDARRRVAEAADINAKAGQLGELIFLESPYRGFAPGFTGAVTPFAAEHGRRFGDLSGFVVGYSRTFIAPGTYTSGEGFVTAEVYEFDSPASAAASLMQHLKSRCQDVAATFTIPAIPDALGISVRGSAPPVEDAVLFVRGPRRFLITRGLKGPSEDHLEAGALAVQAATIAR